MKPEPFYLRIVKPTLEQLAVLPATKIAMSPQAAVLMMAIAGQESGWSARRQVGGPARSYWQFEQYGGVAEVFQKTPNQLRAVCDLLDIPFQSPAVFEAMAWNDTLGCTMARLLLWQDVRPLPAIGNKVAAWDYYIRNWRPELPHPELWEANYTGAMKAVGADTRQQVMDLGGG